MKKTNIIIFIAIGVLIGFSFLATKAIGGSGRAYVIVQSEGQEIMQFTLDGTDKTEKIQTEAGYNIIKIKNGEAAVIQADCKDKLCIKRGAINKMGQSAVCLPHRLILRIEGGEQMGVDSIAE